MRTREEVREGGGAGLDADAHEDVEFGLWEQRGLPGEFYWRVLSREM